MFKYKICVLWCKNSVFMNMNVVLSVMNFAFMNMNVAL